MPGIYDHGHCNYYVSKNRGAYCKHRWMKMFCQYACGYCKEGKDTADLTLKKDKGIIKNPFVEC